MQGRNHARYTLRKHRKRDLDDLARHCENPGGGDPNAVPRNACSPPRLIGSGPWIAWPIPPAWRGRLETAVRPQERRALTLLDSLRDGAAKEFLLLSEFKREMLAQLVLAGLVTVVTETIPTGTSTIEVERYYITDDGRKALEE